MADESFDLGSIAYAVVALVVVYQIIQSVDFGTGITDTIMTYLVPLLAMVVVQQATSDK